MDDVTQRVLSQTPASVAATASQIAQGAFLDEATAQAALSQLVESGKVQTETIKPADPAAPRGATRNVTGYIRVL